MRMRKKAWARPDVYKRQVCLGSNPSSAAIEVWLSLVERYVRDVEAGGSNPLTSTSKSRVQFVLGFFAS